MNRRRILSLGAAWAGLAVPWCAHAQPYPSRPVKIIVPTAAGSIDLLARALAQRLQTAMGQPFIVEQKPGASTNIGSDFVAKSPPDGHTLLINGITLAVNPALFDTLQYNPVRDLAPIIEVAVIPNVVTVHPDLPMQSMRELVQQAKATPGGFSYGSPGVGSSNHLSAELLTVKTGARFTHVPYPGNGRAMNDHLSGLLPVGFNNVTVALPFIKTGKLRAMAVTGAHRSAMLPDVPTVAEALGIRDYALTGWFGILAPARTPPDVVARLNTEIAKVLRDPAFIEVVRSAGGEVRGGTAQEFAHLMAADTQRLSEIVRASGARAN